MWSHISHVYGCVNWNCNTYWCLSVWFCFGMLIDLGFFVVFFGFFAMVAISCFNFKSHNYNNVVVWTVINWQCSITRLNKNGGENKYTFFFSLEGEYMISQVFLPKKIIFLIQIHKLRRDGYNKKLNIKSEKIIPSPRVSKI